MRDFYFKTRKKYGFKRLRKGKSQRGKNIFALFGRHLSELDNRDYSTPGKRYFRPW